MFKTKNLIARSIYETDKLICMEVVTKYDRVYVTQILVSKHDKKPYYDESWVDDFTETSVIHLNRKEVKEEIEAGVTKYFEVRNKIPTVTVKQ